MMQVRELLEPEAAAGAAVSATSEEIDTLRWSLEGLEQAFRSRDPRVLALAESQLHNAMANASGNPLLAALTVSISDLLIGWAERTATQGFAEDVNKSHRVIVEAITARDPQRARQACMSHMQMSRRARASLVKEP
jgi:DNA-binding FadR family transcriptional regulator